jgi:hypothetical protein
MNPLMFLAITMTLPVLAVAQNNAEPLVASSKMIRGTGFDMATVIKKTSSPVESLATKQFQGFWFLSKIYTDSTCTTSNLAIARLTKLRDCYPDGSSYAKVNFYEIICIYRYVCQYQCMNVCGNIHKV